MPAKEIVFALVTALHDIFTAAWIGGLLTLVLSVLPAARKTLGMETTQRLMDAIQKRLSVVIYVSMVGLAVTGLLLSNRAPGFEGLFHFGAPYATLLSLKHLVMLLMVGLALFRSLGLARLRLPAPRKQKLSLALLVGNLALGVLILVFTGLLAAAGTLPAP
ncbi:MAG: hypothetical protein JW892_11750 [Anaerolineae bacterium]|nr:hypothetical protein [Anaerolineae bacterium]